MSQLKPFSEKNLCTKCALNNTYLSDYFTVSHCPCCFLFPLEEHLHKKCSNCHYEWIEKTADAK